MAHKTRKLGLFDSLLRWLSKKKSVMGSDIYVHYSAAYVWQANQFGHMFIGLSITLLFLWIFCGSIWVVVGVLSIYFVKELLDCLIAVRRKENFFPVNLREAIADSSIDWLFVAIGAVAAASVGGDSGASRAVCICAAADPAQGIIGAWHETLAWLGDGVSAIYGVAILFFFFVRIPYLAQKHAFDKSALPYFTRLSLFPENFVVEVPWKSSEEIRDVILAFAKGNAVGQHLVISGPPLSGRTTLAACIGGDATTLRRKVRYLSSGRLAEKTRSGEVPSKMDQPYQVSEAALVIVDDVEQQISQNGSSGQTKAELSALIDVGTGANGVASTVFQRTVNSAKDQDRAMPQVIWVASEGLERELWQALIERFPESRKAIFYVRLREKLADICLLDR